MKTFRVVSWVRGGKKHLIANGRTREEAQAMIEHERRRLHREGYDAMRVSLMDGLGFQSYQMNDYDKGRPTIEVYAEKEEDR